MRNGSHESMIYIPDALSTTITMSNKESFISDPEMSSASSMILQQANLLACKSGKNLELSESLKVILRATIKTYANWYS